MINIFYGSILTHTHTPLAYVNFNVHLFLLNLQCSWYNFNENFVFKNKKIETRSKNDFLVPTRHLVKWPFLFCRK